MTPWGGRLGTTTQEAGAQRAGALQAVRDDGMSPFHTGSGRGQERRGARGPWQVRGTAEAEPGLLDPTYDCPPSSYLNISSNLSMPSVFTVVGYQLMYPVLPGLTLSVSPLAMRKRGIRVRFLLKVQRP